MGISAGGTGSRSSALKGLFKSNLPAGLRCPSSLEWCDEPPFVAGAEEGGRCWGRGAAINGGVSAPILSGVLEVGECGDDVGGIGVGTALPPPAVAAAKSGKDGDETGTGARGGGGKSAC